MAQAKINIERFDGKSDFNILNKKKMYVVMVHQKCAKTLGGKSTLAETMPPLEVLI